MVISLASVHAESSAPIITRFYDLLTAKDAPSEDQEAEFFGTKSNFRGMLQNARKWPIKVPETLFKYEHSKTPVWDYLRDNKNLFLPFGYKDFNEIAYSGTFSYIRSGKSRDTKYIDVFFVSDRNNPAAGFRTVQFCLGKESEKYLLDIDSTRIRGFDGYSIPEYASRPEPPDIFRMP